MCKWLIFALLAACGALGQSRVFAQTPGIVTIWPRVAMDKRCQAILDFVHDWSRVEMPSVKLEQPTCTIRGGTTIPISWSFAAHWIQSSKAFDTLHIFTGRPDGSTNATECDPKNSKAEVCVAWDQKGQDVMKAFNPKLRELTDAIQKWAGKPVPQLRVFDRKQDEWATALSDKQVTLRLGDESVSLKLVGKLKDAPSASVELAKPLAEALKKCVGCVGQECDKVALTWRVEGLNLNFYNANGRNTAPVVTWFAQSPNPGLDWFGACGEARFYIEKL